MKLTIETVQKLIKKPANEDIIIDSRIRHAKLAMHVNGTGVELAVEKLEGLESEEQKELRRRLVKSTRSTFATLLRPFDKVFAANGGSVYYDIKDPEFTVYINSLAGGIGLRTWLKQYWKNKFMTDPNGIILIEVDYQGNPEPKYKSVTNIRDYVYQGTDLEYIIFEPIKGKNFPLPEGVEIELKQDGEYYRVIDDEADRIVLVEGETATEVEELTLPNLWGRVPGVLCSDMVQPESDGKMSPVEEVIDVANELLRDTSIHSVYKALHSYPLFWAYLPDCPHCDGTGKIEGEQCRYCKGKKKDLSKDVSKILGLEPPEEGEPNIAPPGGYVQPDLGSWTEQRTELDWLKREMHFTLWGTHTREQAANETATGRFIDAQPVHDRLDDFATTTEKLEQKLTDFIGEYKYKGYKGSSVSYGRRYLIETPETIWKRYQDARESGSPRSTLDYLLEQFYEVEFKHQPMQMEIHIKLMNVER